MATRAAPKKKAPAKTKASEPKPYSVSFVMGNDNYRADGKTIIEAVEAIEMPRFIKGKILITVHAGELKSEMTAYQFSLARCPLVPS